VFVADFEKRQRPAGRRQSRKEQRQRTPLHKTYDSAHVFGKEQVAEMILRTGNDLETSELLFVSSFCSI